MREGQKKTRDDTDRCKKDADILITQNFILIVRYLIAGL